MDAAKVVEIMGRELAAIGQYYRNDWSGFDGRTLRSQLADLASWGDKATKGETQEEYTDFTEMLVEQASDG
jgi:hypothetical protein